MIEYIKCGLFFVAFTIGIYIFGSFISNGKSSWAQRFVKGYFVYSFFVAIFGMTIQILNLKWKIFEVSIILLFLLIFLYCSYCWLKKEKKITKINTFLKNNWFLIVITLFLMGLTCFHYIGYWFNNHLDDGYYINKIAMYPYVSNPFRMVPATGFAKNAIDSYILNTYELEASLFVYLLKVTPTLYCRFFLSGFNYFLLLNVICVFNEKILKLSKYDFKEHFIQYTTLIVLFFAFDERFLVLNNISILKDSNQFCNAMYYGSSIVRMMGIMILLCPLINSNKINKELIIKYFVISVVLISKSSIALPIIIGIAVSYLIIYLLNGEKRDKLLLIGLLLAFMLSNIILYKGNTLELVNTAFNVFKRNIVMIGVIPFFVLFIFMYLLLLKNEKITNFNNLLIVFFILTTVPFINTLISKFSFYTFVVERTFTCFYYTLVIIVFLYICIFISKKVCYKIFIFITLCVLVCGDLYSLKKAGGSIFEDVPMTELHCKYALKVMMYENKFIPNSVLELGDVLNELNKKSSDDLNVLSREYHTIDGEIYTLAASLTSVSPNIRSISSKFRYDGGEQDTFSTYSIEDQNTLEQFMFNYNKENYNNFKNMLKKYPIDCIVLTVNDKSKQMSKLGYSLHKKIIDKFENVEFYVYVLNN